MPSEELHYNFVFFFARDDYWEGILGTELYHSSNVHVYKSAFSGHPFLQKLFKLHWSYRLNQIVRLPLKSIWFRLMYHQKFEKKLPLCFVYMGGNSIFHDGGFTEYVRKMDPSNRQVILHNDLIAKKCKFDYKLLRDRVDLCTTYDYQEAQKFGIHYIREDFYSRILDLPEQPEFDCDVYFLGAAKDRLEEILRVYNHLSGNGIKCKFLIAGVPIDQQIRKNGIEYITNISYKENIQNVIKAKCVLEIIQKESVDLTTRALEAIAYQRRLLTNCQLVPDGYFHPGQLQVFSRADEIDVKFLEQPFDQDAYIPLADLNPFRRLYDIQEQLEKNGR